MLLNADQEMIRDAVRDFVRTEITPHAARWDKEHHFPKNVHQGLAALGAYGICVPEEYGGAGLDYLSLALVLEEIAAGDGGTSTVISVTNCPVNAILMRYGSEAQKQQWLALTGQLVDRKSTRLNSSHLGISYAVFCLKKKRQPSGLPATEIGFYASPHPNGPCNRPAATVTAPIIIATGVAGPRFTRCVVAATAARMTDASITSPDTILAPCLLTLSFLCPQQLCCGAARLCLFFSISSCRAATLCCG